MVEFDQKLESWIVVDRVNPIIHLEKEIRIGSISMEEDKSREMRERRVRRRRLLA